MQPPCKQSWQGCTQHWPRGGPIRQIQPLSRFTPPWTSSITATASHGSCPLHGATAGTRCFPSCLCHGHPGGMPHCCRQPPPPFAICLLSIPTSEGMVRRQMHPREGPRGRSWGRRVGSRPGCTPHLAVLTHSAARASPLPWACLWGAACTWRASGGRRSGTAGQSRR